MAGATVTIRELKNKDTCIDLSVTSYKETKALLGSTYEYQVMVVSNLSFFKSAKHKDTDNVQFTSYRDGVYLRQYSERCHTGVSCRRHMVLRKFNDFEELYIKLNTKYSGTVFPQLPKKVLMMSESIAKERRNSLDHFVKFLAITTKICTCSLLLEFLGVSAMKAGKFRKMEVSDSIVDKPEPVKNGDKQTVLEEETWEENENENLFDDDDEGDVDDGVLFSADTATAGTTDDTRLFDDQDLGGGLVEGDSDDLFITDAKPETAHQVSSKRVELEEHDENDDLFSIDDDLDTILQLSLKKSDDNSIPTKQKSENESAAEETSNEKTLETKSKSDDSINEEVVTSPIKPKPSLKPKPALKSKPVIPKRTDQSKSSNQTVAISQHNLNSNTSQSEGSSQKPLPAQKQKPPLKEKPALGKKPDMKPKPSANQDSRKESTAEESQFKGDNSVNDKKDNPLDAIKSEDDIMKYIQANVANEDEDDLDLFS